MIHQLKAVVGYKEDERGGPRAAVAEERVARAKSASSSSTPKI